MHRRAAIALSACLIAGAAPALAQEADPEAGSPAPGVGSPAAGVGSPAPGVESPAAAVGSPTPSALVEPAAGPWPFTELPGAAAIAAGEDAFVVVGSAVSGTPGAAAWTSPDGLAWSPSPADGALEGATMSVVTAFGDGFVALGTEIADAPEEQGQRVIAWTSEDGVTWQRGTLQRPRRKGFSASVQDVAVGPGGLLAFANIAGQDLARQRLWRSADGRSWRSAEFPEAKNVVFSSITGYPDGYLLTAAKGPGKGKAKDRFWRSADGVTWETIAGPADGRPLDTAARADGTVVAIGGRTEPPRAQAIWTSPDLASWQLVWESPNPQSLQDEEQLLWVTWDGASFVTTGTVQYGAQPCSSGEGQCPVQPILTSADGTTWVESVGPDGVPGPDPETYLAGTASLGGTTVALGQAPGGATVAWLVGA